jgi:hypothetical protein
MSYSGRPFELLTCKLLNLTLLENVPVDIAAMNNLTCVNGCVVDDGIDCVKLEMNKIIQIYQCKCYTFPYSKITKRKLITYLKYVRNYKFKDIEKYLVISDRRTISLKLFKKLTDLNVKVIEIRYNRNSPESETSIHELNINDIKLNGYLRHMELTKIESERMNREYQSLMYSNHNNITSKNIIYMIFNYMSIVFVLIELIRLFQMIFIAN